MEPINPEAIERVKSAPSQCPACGGAFTQPFPRGMDSLTCPFCGNGMRLLGPSQQMKRGPDGVGRQDLFLRSRGFT
jgi:rRNA maturation endonuclease Nob1